MATIKSEYYRFNGNSWDLHYFKTSADLLVETTSYKVMTADERTAIANYLSTFNAANKLVKLDASNKIPVTHIPGLSYLPLTGGALTGALTGTNLELSGNIRVNGSSYINGGITSDNGAINVYGGINMHGGLIHNLDSPVEGNQAATKEYVDNLVAAGFKVKDPVKAASTANIDITLALNSLDGYTLAANDRVLLKNQTTASQNGVYQLNASKVPVKVAADSTLGNSVFVENGTTQNDYIFVTSVLNTWSMFARPDTITVAPGGGLTKSGTTLSIANGGVTNAMLAGSINPSKLANFTTAQNIEGITAAEGMQHPSTSQTLISHLTNLYSAIKLIRGTERYNDAPLITIPQVKTIAESKIKCDVGTAVPTETGVATGNLYFRTIG